MEVPAQLAQAIRNDIHSYGPILEGGVSLLIEKTYPEIDQFKVEIFPNESQHRGRPHCRVTTDKGAVTIDFLTGEVLAGDAGHWTRTACKTVVQHKDGLLALWNATRPTDQKLSN